MKALLPLLLFGVALCHEADGRTVRQQDQTPRAPLALLDSISGHWVGQATCQTSATLYVDLEIRKPVWKGHSDEWAKLAGRPTRDEKFPNHRELVTSFYRAPSELLEQIGGWGRLVEGEDTGSAEEVISIFGTVPRRSRKKESPPHLLDIATRGSAISITVYRTGCEPFVLRRSTSGLSAGDFAPGSRPTGMYRASDFKGLRIWIEAYRKAVEEPDEFDKFLAGLRTSPKTAAAVLNTGMSGAERHSQTKFIGDLSLQRLYVPRYKDLLERSKECTVARDYSPAEACDCIAGLPGDAKTGAGVGELVVQSNQALVRRACTSASAAAQTDRERGRFLAQRARSEILATDQSAAGNTIKTALSMGYGRAQILYAWAELYHFEVGTQLIPPPSRQDFDATASRGAEAIATARKLGIRDVYVVAEQWKHAIHNFDVNVALLESFSKWIFEPLDSKDSCGTDCLNEQMLARRQDNAIEWASRKDGRRPDQYRGD